jgi:Zn-dependent protease with chaperone function
MHITGRYYFTTSLEKTGETFRRAAISDGGRKGMMAWDSPVMGYLTEVFFHSLLTAMVVEVLLSSWGIARPASRLRFRSLTLILPVLLPLLYRFTHPSRSGDFFRENAAIFDGSEWLRLGLWGGFTLWHLTVMLIGITTFLFIVQELAPLISGGGVGRRRRSREPSPDVPRRLEAAIDDLAERLNRPELKGIDVILVGEGSPLLCTRGFIRPSLVVSWSLLELLDAEELKCALAHEIIHIVRKDHLKAWVMLLFRGFMFYNPVALLSFRSIINDNEKACDDAAVEITGNSLAFASGLLKVYKTGLNANGGGAVRGSAGWLDSISDSMAKRSHRARIEERVGRLVEEGKPKVVLYEEFRLGFLAGSLAVLLFFVV